VVNPGCRLKMSAMESTLPTTSFVNVRADQYQKSGPLRKELGTSNLRACELAPVNFSSIHALRKVIVGLRCGKSADTNSPMSCVPPWIICEIKGHHAIPLQDPLHACCQLSMIFPNCLSSSSNPSLDMGEHVNLCVAFHDSF